MNNRDNLVEIFQDTEKWCKDNKTLASAIQRTQAETKVYPADSVPEFSASDVEIETEITVTDNRTFAAANGADILVLGAFGCGAFQNRNFEVFRRVFGA